MGPTCSAIEVSESRLQTESRFRETGLKIDIVTWHEAIERSGGMKGVTACHVDVTWRAWDPSLPCDRLSLAFDSAVHLSLQSIPNFNGVASAPQ
jgi:hypothetical protein